MKKIILFVTLLCISLSSKATLLTINLNQDNYQIGDVLTADFIISDIETDNSNFTKLLATFDFNVFWDETFLTYTSFSFGNNLNVGAFDSNQSVTAPTSNSLLLSEVSNGWWDELLSVQDGLSSFVLATVNFNVISSGISELGLSDVVLGDDFGVAYTDVISNNKAYSVTTGSAVSVPEPSSILLILMALAMLLVKQREVN
jgi:hypothetical protein